MSTPSDSSIKGKFDELVGHAKQSIGETVGNEKLANEGTAEQVKGHVEQAWGSVKEGAADLKTQKEAEHANDAHNAREKVSSTSENIKDSVQSGIDHLTHKS